MPAYRALALAGLVLTAAANAGPAAPQPALPGAPAQTSSSQGYRFPSGAGILYFHVRTDHVPAFEDVIARIDDALDKAEDPVRRQQAASWRIFRSLEQQPGEVLYLFVFDPAVTGADYDPVRLLGEAVPTEAQALYETLKTAVIRVERMGLLKMR